MHALIFFDDGGGRLGPLTDLRASFELRTGGLTTGERLAEQVGRHPDALLVPDALAPLVASRHTEPVNRPPWHEHPARDADAMLFLNGRWSRINHDLPDRPNRALLDADGSVLAALLDRHHAEAFIASRGQRLEEGVETSAARDAGPLTRPWHVLVHAEANLEHDLRTLAKRLQPYPRRGRSEARGGLRELSALYEARDGTPGIAIVGEQPVLVGKGVTIHPHVVFDTSAGPIAIDDGAEVRSISVIVGPGYIGAGSAIANHAHIRGHCSIGPMCKVGGEVNRCVFQGRSNKAHSGYLGNSFVGEWVNLGADTTTSNLKNTYGEVRVQMDPDSPAEPTGLTHVGSIIGDHAKTAIGTRLLTGSCIGTGAMLAAAGFPPKCPRHFAFVTDAGEDRYDLDKFHRVAETVMARRGEQLSPALRQRLADLHHGSAGGT